MNNPLSSGRQNQEIAFLQNTSQASVNMITVIFDFLISKSENPEETKRELQELISKHSNFNVNPYVEKVIKLVK